jgi:TetR/AcrR family transcriptional regulator, cholesterol catabolism regulator
MENSDYRLKLLFGAKDLFLRFGVRSVSMDDIARHLGISKKTIYQYFQDKDELVTTIASTYIEEDKKTYQAVMDAASNAIEESFACTQCLRKQLEQMNPSLLFDLQKYHPSAWQVYLEYKNSFIRSGIIKNIERGISEGYFRPDINPEIIAIFRLEQVQMAFDEDLFTKNKFNIAEVQLHLFEHFMHGLLTEKGRNLYENYKRLLNQTIIDQS